jgi:polar amino acid transport system substrate-binding protein
VTLIRYAIALVIGILPYISTAKNIDISNTLYIVTHHFPPYSVCEGKVVKESFIKDVIDQACRIGHLSCVLECFPNRRSKAMLMSGLAHGHYPLAWNSDREEWLSWSPKLNASEYGFFVNDQHTYKKMEDFIGKTIGVFGPSNAHKELLRIQNKLLIKQGKTFIVSVQPSPTGINMKKLSANRLDAVFINRFGGNMQINNVDINNVSYAFSVKKINYYVGFSKKKNTIHEKETMNTFNQSISLMHKEKIISNILEKYSMPAFIDTIR